MSGSGLFAKCLGSQFGHLFRSLVVLLVAIHIQPARSADNWVPIRESSLEVAKGSVLDFSDLHDNGVAGERGWIVPGPDGRLRLPGKNGVAQRFLCASLVPSAPNGGFPAREEADRLVEQMVRAGYNSVRIHFLDGILMSGRDRDFDFDPIALDRLFYFLAKLKASGIYWILDVMGSDNGGYGGVYPHRWVNKYDLKSRLYFDVGALEHWKRLATAMLSRKNPYTGIAPVMDPALLGLVYVNESGLDFMARVRGRYPPELKVAFGRWLAGRYPDEKNFSKAWGADVGKGDKLGVSVELPDVGSRRGIRSNDFAMYVVDREAYLFRSMDAHLRSMGYKGLGTAFNNFSSYLADAGRNSLDWVDMHAYQSLPSSFDKPGSTVPQKSIFDDVGRYARELANARQWGKPFIATEYGQPFWNKWRHETTAFLPAFAAFQDWDGISQFAEVPVLMRYGDSPASRRQAIYPYGIGGDPITRGGERLAASLFLRGDVYSARSRIVFELDKDRLIDSGYAQEHMPERFSKLSLTMATGISMQPDALRSDTRFKDETRINLIGPSNSYLGKVRDVMASIGMGGDPIQSLKASGVLAASNKSRFKDGYFQTDTGQLKFDAENKTFSVETDRTVVFTRRGGDARSETVQLSGLSGPATVAVSSVDELAIDHSRRLLVWVLTDAVNTGMEFADEDRATMRTLGHFPPQIRAVSGQLTITHADAGALSVWAIDQSGRRVARVPTQTEVGTLRFAIDNVIPDYGPVTYFEVAER